MRGELRQTMAEIGDLRRFESPRRLMGYLGPVPGERSMGESVHRLGTTKAGNGRVRHTVIEGAWCHRHPPSTGRGKHQAHERVPPVVRDIAHQGAVAAVRPPPGAVEQGQ